MMLVTTMLARTLNQRVRGSNPRRPTQEYHVLAGCGAAQPQPGVQGIAGPVADEHGALAIPLADHAPPPRVAVIVGQLERDESPRQEPLRAPRHHRGRAEKGVGPTAADSRHDQPCQNEERPLLMA